MKTKLLLTSLISLMALLAHSQATIGLKLHKDGNDENGYVLFTPMRYTDTYLINKCGKLVHSWVSTYTPCYSVYLLPDGSLLRPGNIHNPVFNGGGILEKLDWNSNPIWQYTLSSENQCQHHDVRPLPNGNVLAIVWELKTPAEEQAAGRRPNYIGNSLWSEKIVELQPTGLYTANIVWEWKVWDHLVQQYDSLNPNNYGIVADHPELININYNPGAPLQADWLHANGLDYNADLDQIVLSAHNFCEIWIIDHSTSTAEAASHTGGNSGKGGDLLYRWGNPAAYRQGLVTDKKFYGQHNPRWIPATFPHGGSIMVFNNGLNRPGNDYSSVEIISPPTPDPNGNYNSTMPYLPVAQDWIYTAPNPTDFYSSIISGAQMLSTGNVLICNGSSGEMFEIDTNELRVWEYVNPVEDNGPVAQGTNPIANQTFRCSFYDQNYSGFSGQTLTAGNPIELNPLPYICNLTTEVNPVAIKPTSPIFPNPARNSITLASGYEDYLLQVFDVNGQEIPVDRIQAEINISNLAPGLYILKLSSPAKLDKFTKMVKY